MIAKTITEKLAGTTDGRRALGGFLRSLGEVSSLVQGQVPASSVKIARDFQKNPKSSSHAPLMLHSSGTAAPQTTKAPRSGNGLNVLFQELEASEKLEPTTGLEPVTYALRSRPRDSGNSPESLPSYRDLPDEVVQISQEIAENISVILHCAENACSANAPRGPDGSRGRSRRRGGSP